MNWRERGRDGLIPRPLHGYPVNPKAEKRARMKKLYKKEHPDEILYFHFVFNSDTGRYGVVFSRVATSRAPR